MISPFPTLSSPSRVFVAVGALFGAAAVVGSAWAAHAAQGGWDAETLSIAFNQLGLHAVAILAWGLGRDRLPHPGLSAAAGALLALGVLTFAGALIASAGGTSIGPVAPVGGLAMIAGWLLAAASAVGGRSGAR